MFCNAKSKIVKLNLTLKSDPCETYFNGYLSCR